MSEEYATGRVAAGIYRLYRDAIIGQTRRAGLAAMILEHQHLAHVASNQLDRSRRPSAVKLGAQRELMFETADGVDRG